MDYMATRINRLRFSNWRKLFIYRRFLVIAAVVILVGYFWHNHNNDKLPRASSNTGRAIQNIFEVRPSPTSRKNEATGPKNPAAKSSGPSSTLLEPYGTYVSNHTPSSVDQSLDSSCITTPGAICQIQFTMSGITKSLTAETADSSGVAGWTWTPAQVGLTAGSWKVSMLASLKGQLKSSNDLIALQIP